MTIMCFQHYTKFLLLMLLLGLTCTPPPSDKLPSEQTPEPSFLSLSDDEANTVELVFTLELERSVYRDSDFGDPPQMALWLEDPSAGAIHTIWVTRSTGKGLWLGKIECPVSLPYWVSRYNRETGTQGPPTFKQPVVDAVTGATPTTTLTRRIRVPAGSRWDYYLEINVSGDFNEYFQRIRADGLPDPQENGQPSLIYRGCILASSSADSEPQLIGRTDQWNPTDQIIIDLSGITSAKDLLKSLKVTCTYPRNPIEVNTKHIPK
ncbi:MAG: hypothetical protein JW709_04135 [Sedimentisphaerales bacterium]|nr:hypothetical protein [Sedimentisphaerales bacterium]